MLKKQKKQILQPKAFLVKIFLKRAVNLAKTNKKRMTHLYLISIQPSFTRLKSKKIIKIKVILSISIIKKKVILLIIALNL